MRGFLRACLPVVLLSALSGAAPATSSVDTTTAKADTAQSLHASSSATAKADSTLRRVTRADTVQVAKHDFDHREQVITGGVIMACLIGILAFMNNYNPR